MYSQVRKELDGRHSHQRKALLQPSCMRRRTFCLMFRRTFRFLYCTTKRLCFLVTDCYDQVKASLRVGPHVPVREIPKLGRVFLRSASPFLVEKHL
jgi:hypothetical protein